MNGDCFINNSFSKFIEIKGKDSTNFLQGLITNDINECKVDNPIYACLLTPQGKFLADFFIIQIIDKYLVEIHEKYFEMFISKLKMYKLRAIVDFSINESISSIIFFAKELQKIPKDIISFQDPRHPNIGQKLFINKNNLKKINKFKELDFKKYKEILMKNLVPYTPDDLIENQSLLLENNFHNINAISWEKGCFVGQEITARMKYRSLLKKQIYALEILSGNINPGDYIIQKNINIGSVISKTGQYVLCMLKINLIKNKSLNKEKIKTDSNALLKFL
jgi:hypothetical protein